jgi:hypothetical protein
MGLDVVFKVRPDPDLEPDEFSDLRRRFYKAHPDPRAKGEEDHYPRMAWDVDESQPTIEVDLLDRYYAVDYERGPWPSIREIGEWLAANISGELRYGSDSAYEWEFLRPWSQVRDELDAHWGRVENRPYRERW